MRTRSSRPGERTAANAARTVSCSIGPVAAPAPRNASTAASAVDRVLRLVGAEQRQEDLLVLAAQALQAHLLPADGDPPLQHAELGALAGDDGLHLDGPAHQGVERARLLVGQHGDRVGLDDPGLLAGDRGDVGPEVLGVVERDRA